jgi:hypothetical protein
VPAGYLRADGSTYRNRGAFSYGWTTPAAPARTVTRRSPDQRYDALIHSAYSGALFFGDLAVPS